ncbi:P2Y purinoceptor 1 [Mobula hypostoma]|uniref:P2Y purinoceptor 1 n=1 Tax=Mobula hypostoma TaxID=723540 RepID=UPI002FC35D50
MEVSPLIAVSLAPDFMPPNHTAACEINRTFQYIFLSVTYAIVFLVGFFMNSLVLVCLCLRRRKWARGNLFVFNLALADLLYVITLPFFMVYYASHSRWIFGKYVCRISRLVFHLNLYGSIGFLTCISVQRYLGIVHPMKMLGRWKTRHSALISLLVWGLVLIQTQVDLYFTKTNVNGSKCYDTTSNEEITSYLLYVRVISVTGFLIPFLLIVGCYCQIAVVLSKKRSLGTGAKERSRNLAIIIMLLFSVCFAPYHVLRYLNLMSRHSQWKGLCAGNTKSVYLFYQITRGLTSLNSCIDPFIYFVSRGGMVNQTRTFSVQVRSLLVRRGQSSVSQRNLFNRKTPTPNETVV